MASKKNSGNGGSGGSPPTLDSATTGAIEQLTSVAQGAVATAQTHSEALATAQTGLDEAIAQATAANERIVALGGTPIEIPSSNGTATATAPRRRRNSGGRSSSSAPRTSGRRRPRNPYDFPTSILIAMAGSRVGTEFDNAAIQAALRINQDGGFRTNANETSLRTQITQNIGRVMDGNHEAPKGSFVQVRRGVYAITSEGKAFVKGCSLADAVEADESESSD